MWAHDFFQGAAHTYLLMVVFLCNVRFFWANSAHDRPMGSTACHSIGLLQWRARFLKIYFYIFTGMRATWCQYKFHSTGRYVPNLHVEKIKKVAAKHAFGFVACIFMTTINADSHPPCVVQRSACVQSNFSPRKQSGAMIIMLLLHWL